MQATQNRISIGSRARPRSLVVTCRATECRVMSYRLMCRIVSFRAMLCHVMLFHVCRVVSCRRVFRVVSGRVLSRPVVSMWWSPNCVCAQAFFCQRIMSVTRPRTVIRLRTARPPHIFSSSRRFTKRERHPSAFPPPGLGRPRGLKRTTPRSTIHAGGCWGLLPRDSRLVSSCPGVAS